MTSVTDGIPKFLRSPVLSFRVVFSIVVIYGTIPIHDVKKNIESCQTEPTPRAMYGHLFCVGQQREGGEIQKSIFQ